VTDSIDLTSILATSLMVAFLRVIEALAAAEQGIPLDSLQPTSVEALDAEAREYVAQIVARHRPSGGD